jgi:hypothetical protein
MARIREGANAVGLTPISVSLCETDNWNGTAVSGIVNNIHPYHSQGYSEIGPASMATA